MFIGEPRLGRLVMASSGPRLGCWEVKGKQLLCWRYVRIFSLSLFVIELYFCVFFESLCSFVEACYPLLFAVVHCADETGMSVPTGTARKEGGGGVPSTG